MTKLLVIADSSSLILGTKAGLLNAICREFLVKIPEKVFEEAVTAGKNLQKIDAFKIEEEIRDKRIIVEKVKSLNAKE